MPLLVVVDLAVAGDEAWEKLLLAQIARRELERREARSALEDLLVDRDECDLRGEIVGTREEPIACGKQLLIEDRAEGSAEELARSPDVLRDERGL